MKTKQFLVTKYFYAADKFFYLDGSLTSFMESIDILIQIWAQLP